MSFVRHAILSLLCLIDEAIYSIASMIYSLLMYIAESNIFTQETIQSFATRIYVLIGVFMLFKVAFSLINYIVNPDDFTKGERGVNKLVSNVMISLVLIVFTPRIFAEAMELQKLITSQHFFEKIILSTGYNEAIENDPGDNMAISLFSAFFYYVDEAPTSDNYYKQLDGTTYFAYADMWSAFDSESEYNAYEGIWDDKATYKPIISTAAGVVLILVLIQFCFDIAIRAVKLGFLELMAPIPIISRMDPKSAKNGIFSKWLKECINTYIDLFVRLVALFFAIYVINLILETPFAVDPDTNGITQMLVRAMLMLGALLFARQLPKFISSLFGVNLGNGFTLNPMRRMREVPGFNRVTGGLGGAYQRAVGRLQQEGQMGTNRGRAILRALGSGVAGAGAGVLANRGFRGQMTAARQTQRDLQAAAHKLRLENPNLSQEEAMRQAREEQRTDRRRNFFGLETSKDINEREKAELAIEKAAFDKAEKQRKLDHEKEQNKFRERQQAIDEEQKIADNRKRDAQHEMDAAKAVSGAASNFTKNTRANALDHSKPSTTSVADMKKQDEIDKLKQEQEQLLNNNIEKQQEMKTRMESYKARESQITTEAASRRNKLTTESEEARKKATLDAMNKKTQLNEELSELIKKEQASTSVGERDALKKAIAAKNAEIANVDAEQQEAINKINENEVQENKNINEWETNEKAIANAKVSELNTAMKTLQAETDARVGTLSKEISDKDKALKEWQKTIGNSKGDNTVSRYKISKSDANVNDAYVGSFTIKDENGTAINIDTYDDKGNVVSSSASTTSFKDAYDFTDRKVKENVAELSKKSSELNTVIQELNSMDKTDPNYSTKLAQKETLIAEQKEYMNKVNTYMEQRDDILIKHSQQTNIEAKLQTYNDHYNEMIAAKNEVESQFNSIKSDTSIPQSVKDELQGKIDNYNAQIKKMEEFKTQYDEYQSNIQQYATTTDATIKADMSSKIEEFKNKHFKANFYQEKQNDIKVEYEVQSKIVEDCNNIIKSSSSTKEQIAEAEIKLSLAQTKIISLSDEMTMLSKDTDVSKLDQDEIADYENYRKTIENNQDNLHGIFKDAETDTASMYASTKNENDSITSFMNNRSEVIAKNTAESYDRGEKKYQLEQERAEENLKFENKNIEQQEYERTHFTDPESKLNKRGTSIDAETKYGETNRNEHQGQGNGHGGGHH